MGKKEKPKAASGRSIVRKGDQIIGVFRNAEDRKDFEQRLRTKCEEAGLKIPPSVPYGSGERVAIACKSRDHAIFVFDFAEEALAELPE